MEKEPQFSMVHFFGPDGAGKSVQASILVRNLQSRGIRVKLCWVRAHHTLAFVLWGVLIKIGLYRTVPDSSGTITKLPAVDGNRFLREFWSFIEFISILPLVLRIRWFIFRNYKLIAERYLLDTIVSIAYLINDISFLRSHISILLLRLIPSGTAFIFLDCDYQTIRKRRLHDFVSGNHQRKSKGGNKKRVQRVVESRAFIDFHRKVYRLLGESYSALVINTSEHTIQETSESIWSHLGLAQ